MTRNFLLTAAILVLGCMLHGQTAVLYSPTIIKQDSKYGITDEDGNTRVPPRYDTIICADGKYKNLELLSANPFFILKKEGKYGYAYFMNLDSGGVWLPENDRRWITSDCIYDSISWRSFGYEHYDYNHNGMFNTEPYEVLEYRKNGKWGLMYSMAISATGDFGGSYPIPAGLGYLRMTGAKYELIGDRHDDGVYDVRSNGKWGMLQVIYVPILESSSDMRKWIDLDYGISFDSTLVKWGHESELHLMRFVEINSKWGLVKLSPETRSFEYIIPCESAVEIASLNDKYFITQKPAVDSLTVYDIFNKTKFSIDLKGNQPVDNFSPHGLDVFEFDTVPSKLNYYQESYLMIGLGKFDYETDVYMKGSALYFIDMKRQELKMEYSSRTANYSWYHSDLGVVIMKRTEQGAQNLYELNDLETGKLIWSTMLDSSKTFRCYDSYDGNRNVYAVSNFYNKRQKVEPDGTYIDDDYYHPRKFTLEFYMEIQLMEKGKDPAPYGYYDYLKKKFVKGKPKFANR